MGSDVTAVSEELPSPRSIKVHHSMCIKLIRLVERIVKILPEIEASRPRCSSGLKPLCSLNNGILEAKSLLQQCCEGSKLYLAITGEKILVKCKKTKNSLEQSLGHIQNNVPVLLAAKISLIISDLKNTTFSLDSAEEGVGKALRAFIQNYDSSNDSMENSAVDILRFAALNLQITSQKALLIERRSIRKLLEPVNVEPSKKKIIKYLMVLLKDHGKSIINELSGLSHEESFLRSCDISTDMQSHSVHVSNVPANDTLARGVPPEEYMCPISARLMYDPVIIASGLTFERMWIEKWFNEGHEICPKTKTKLDNFSMTPNINLKDLISKWCLMNGITNSDPSIQSTEAESWDSSLTSIASLSNSMNNLHLPIDFSQMSLGSLDSNSLVSSQVAYNFHSSTIKADDDPRGLCKSRINLKDLDRLNELPWEHQCEVVEDVKEQFQHDDDAFPLISVGNFAIALVRFLRSAIDRGDIKAQRTGTQLLWAFVSRCRSSIPDLPVEVYGLLASLLDFEVTKKTLAIIELLSHHLCCRPQILESGALNSILGILETQTREFLEPVITILNNLSSSTQIWSFIIPSEFIPKLVPFIEDDTLARYCISILRNLCHNEDTRVFVAETSGCIASIVKLLDTENLEVQEHAVTVLLSLCSERELYCQIVMEEGVIPPLIFVSNNGNERGKASALELLRVLQDIKVWDNRRECTEAVVDSCSDFQDNYEKKKPSSKKSRLFGFKIPKF